MKIIEKDVLIIGSGLSGMYTALNIEDSLSVMIVTKNQMCMSNSALAQGGIASCTQKEDTFSAHVRDTLLAGSYQNDISAVTLLVEQAPIEIQRLIELGMVFDRDSQGELLTTLEGGHSKHRVLHANGDATGQVVMETVIERVKSIKNVDIIEYTMVIEIVQDEQGQVMGAVLLSHGEEYIFVHTSCIVIASGGIGALYKDTTNQAFSTGDGIALAKTAGCSLVDMCYIQFHPTAFYGEKGEKKFLISEALRGEGAILKNRRLEAFMMNYDERGDLAPRDIVSKGIFHEMEKEQLEHVWLDMTHHSQGFLAKRFPNIYTFLTKQHIHMEKDLIPVAPVAHYFVGGIKTDMDGRTNVNGIYACGEAASTGVHGANRLASNSLLECLVFGRRIAIHINQTFGHHRWSRSNMTAKMKKEQGLINKKLDQCKGREEHLCKNFVCQQKLRLVRKQDGRDIATKTSKTMCNYQQYKLDIQELMTKYVGIVRTEDGLDKGLKNIRKIKEEIQAETLLCDTYYEIVNMCHVAEDIIRDGIKKDSSGCHIKIIQKRKVYCS